MEVGTGYFKHKVTCFLFESQNQNLQNSSLLIAMNAYFLTIFFYTQYLWISVWES
jgi:hypothetical protein